MRLDDDPYRSVEEIGTEMIEMILYFIIWLISRIVWGYATETVIQNKGYKENWFWWGFLFGLIALIVALSKPQVNIMNNYQTSEEWHVPQRENISKGGSNSALLSDGRWKCYCGTVNASYVGTCGCGRTKEWNLQEIANEKNKNEEKRRNEDELINLQRLNEYKKLLDSGAISKEEFDKKKSEILNI